MSAAGMFSRVQRDIRFVRDLRDHQPAGEFMAQLFQYPGSAPTEQSPCQALHIA